MKTLLIQNCSLLEKNALISSGKNILIADGKIKAITNRPVTSIAEETIDGSNITLTPSFINAHFHLGETLFCGYAPLDSLDRYISFTSRKLRNFTDNDYETVCQKSIIEVIHAGTSAIMAARGWSIVEEAGIKGVLGYPLMDSPKLSEFKKAFGTKIREQMSEDNDKINTCVWIHSVTAISKEEWSSVAKIINTEGPRLTIHVAETKEQVEKSKALTGYSEVEFLNRLGLLNEKTNIVHGAYLTDSELKLIAKQKANLTVCPLSSHKLHQRLPNVNKMLSENINVCLATDGLATGETASLLEVLAFTRNIYKLSNQILLRMITINPAEAIGLNHSGELDVGFDGDICFFENAGCDFESLLALRPIHQIVRGHFVLKNGRVTTLDENLIKNKFEDLIRRKKSELNYLKLR